MIFYNFLKKKFLLIYLYSTFYLFKICIFLEKSNPIVFTHFSRYSIWLGVFASILVNFLNVCILVFYWLFMYFFVLLFTTEKLNTFIIKLSIILFFILINYILSYYNLLLYYKIWRWFVLLLILFFSIRKDIFSFISENYKIYNKWDFFLMILNEILLKLISFYGRLVNKQYNKAKSDFLKMKNKK